MSARSGRTTPRWRRRRLLAQFMEIRIRSRRHVGTLALDRVRRDRQPVGALRLGWRYAKSALHRGGAQRWNGKFRKRLTRVAEPHISEKDRTTLFMSHAQ